MSVEHLALLLFFGALAGFVAGLVGVGGGIIFAPVIFFYFESIGVSPLVITQLTIGSSLLCTLVTSLIATYHHEQKGAVDRRVAVTTGFFSALAVLAMTVFVTTKPWYNADVFQLAFAAILTLVAVRMFFAKQADRPAVAERRGSPLSYFGIGSLAGVISPAVGVGGGIVLVPSFSRLLGLPIHRAVGSSSAAIVLISGCGMLTYMLKGWGNELVPSTALGFVDVGRAALLVLPAIFTARAGVTLAHRVDRIALQRGFAVLALVVAIRLVVRAL